MNIKLLRIVDRYCIGFCVLFFCLLKFLYISQKTKIQRNPKKILVIRLWALGSSLLTFPMIKQLRDHYGNDVQYDLLATSRNIHVFEKQGYFAKRYNLFTLKDLFYLLKSFKKYDIIIDCEEYFNISSLLSLWLSKISVGYGNIWTRSLAYTMTVTYSERQHNIMNTLDLITKLGIEIYEPDGLESLKYDLKDTRKPDIFLHKIHHKKILCLHIGGAETSPDRFWAVSNWIELIELLLNKYGENISIVLSGTTFEQEQVSYIMRQFPNEKNILTICGLFNLFEFAYFLEKCDLMISNDTGPMHLAACMHTKVIGLFGPNIPTIFGPRPLKKNITFYKGTGKIYIQPHKGIFAKDMQNTINKILPSEVFRSIESIIS